MYDPDISVIRQIEIFKAANPDLQLRVYFMLYDGSVEEQRYLSSVSRETDAFQALIREKAVGVFVFVFVFGCSIYAKLCGTRRPCLFLKTKMEDTWPLKAT